MTSEGEATAGTLVRGGTRGWRSGQQVAARLALLLAADQDPVAVRRRLLPELSPLRGHGDSVVELDRRVLVVELRDRAFQGWPRAAVFSPAPGLAEHLGAHEAEPDLPTAYFPAPPPTRVGPAVDASAGAFPAGCWVPEELDLPVGWGAGADRRGAWALSACQAAGLTGITPHDLRHTAASAIAARGNVKAVQRMLVTPPRP